MELKSDQSKQYIAEALIELMKKKEFSTITNKDITDKAGLSHITYYRNFSSKEDIIRYYLDNITNNFIKESKIDYNPNNFKEYLIVLFLHLKNYKNFGMLLCKANLIHYIKDEFDKIFFNKALNKKQQFNYYFISGGLYNVYYFWLINGCKETPEELANMFMDFFTLKENSN